ncbi:MAG: hypothetical protein IJS54_06570 [Desulfovibrio sp.]|nr:hypothetical protein [Desulfovibrio sp.]
MTNGVRCLCVLCVLVWVGIAGCTQGQSAKDCLMVCAKALEDNDAQGFLNQFDLKACALSQIKNMTDSNDALHTLDRLGRTLGIGGMEDLLGNVLDVEHSIKQQFVKKVSTGALVQECSRSEKTGCPWVPTALRNADIRTLSKQAVVARIVSPTKMTTWLAIQKQGEKWRITGWAALEDVAGQYATQTRFDESPEGNVPKRKNQNATTI